MNEINSLPNCSIIIEKSIKMEGYIHIIKIEEIITILKNHNNNNNLDASINILENNKNVENEMNNKQITHDKYSPDNIIKKIKVHLFHILIIFVNSELIGSHVYKTSKLKKLDYKIISNTNKEDNIIYLNMTLEELLSLEITKKYRTKNKNINKNIIQKMLKKRNDDEKIKEKIDYIFKLKFTEWIDIFIMKKEGNINIKFEGLHLLLNEILKNNQMDEKYFVNFVYLLYNFENWFLSKKNKTKKNAKLQMKKKK